PRRTEKPQASRDREADPRPRRTTPSDAVRSGQIRRRSHLRSGSVDESHAERRVEDQTPACGLGGDSGGDHHRHLQYWGGVGGSGRMTGMSIWSRAFWRDTAERAIKTAAQTAIVAWGVGDQLLNLFTADLLLIG